MTTATLTQTLTQVQAAEAALAEQVRRATAVIRQVGLQSLPAALDEFRSEVGAAVARLGNVRAEMIEGLSGLLAFSETLAAEIDLGCGDPAPQLPAPHPAGPEFDPVTQPVPTADEPPGADDDAAEGEPDTVPMHPPAVPFLAPEVAERRAKVRAHLELDPNASNRALMREYGVHNNTVREVRRELGAAIAGGATGAPAEGMAAAKSKE